MGYRLPIVSDFKAQFVRDFPYAEPLLGGGAGAAATAILSGDAVGSVTVDSGGSGYLKAPTIIFQGGGGVEAAGTATLTSDTVAAITVTNGGYGYQKPPTVYISSGKGDNTESTKVTDFDIAYAQRQALDANFTEGLYGSQSMFTLCYNLLAAHYLCLGLQASSTGLGGQSSWLTIGKTVGSVSENYSIPDRVLKSPILSKYSRTTYGSQFLEMVSPRLIGNIVIVRGGSLA